MNVIFLSLLRCPNLAVKEAEDDENIEEEDIIVEIKKSSKKVPIAKKKKQASVKLSWVGEVVEVKPVVLAWRPDSQTSLRVWPRSIGKRLFPGWTLV